jgi:hypothetical protein
VSLEPGGTPRQETGAHPATSSAPQGTRPAAAPTATLIAPLRKEVGAAPFGSVAVHDATPQGARLVVTSEDYRFDIAFAEPLLAPGETEAAASSIRLVDGDVPFSTRREAHVLTCAAGGKVLSCKLPKSAADVEEKRKLRDGDKVRLKLTVDRRELDVVAELAAE